MSRSDGVGSCPQEGAAQQGSRAVPAAAAMRALPLEPVAAKIRHVWLRCCGNADAAIVNQVACLAPLMHSRVLQGQLT